MRIEKEIQEDIKMFKQQLKKTPFFSAERKAIKERLRIAKFYHRWIDNMLTAGYKRMDFSLPFARALNELYEEYREKVEE